MAGPDEPDNDLMMSVLRGFDDARYGEAPAGFDFLEAKQRFLELAQSVNALVGEECEAEVWPGIQDASHHGAILLPPSATIEPSAISVRVSNFGNLATLYDNDEALKPDLRLGLLKLLARRGYRFVPPALLSRRYDGRFESSAIRTWGTRFFDYL